MRLSIGIWVTLILAAGATASAARVSVSLPDVASALSRANAGDIIEILDGEYSDIEMKWRSPGCPVTVQAQNPGKVRISGKSSLKISGDSLTVKGLDFVDAHPAKGNVVEFRVGKELANASRLTECAFHNCNPERRDIVSSYIVLHGRNNRVDHCSLTGKLSLGVTLLINLNDARSLDNAHLVDHNYFGPRPVYGSNGAETMRIGTSQQAYEKSATVVRDNYFDGCSGEVEIISVKSSGNQILNNVFNRCQGVVALRHGKGNTVKGNIFDGKGEPNTGGVRIVDSGHTVSDNTFFNLKGTRFFSALAVMNSVPNSLPNRYVQVSDVDINGNLFADCSNIEFGTGKDMERTEAPVNVRFLDNVIMSGNANPFTMIDENAGVKFTNNKVEPVQPGVIERIKSDCASVLKACGARIITSNSNNAVADTITLDGGVIYRSEPFVIVRPTVIEGNGSTLKWNGSGGENFITIADGGSLKVNNVTFDGSLQQGHGVVKNAISTALRMITGYNLEVKECKFINMPESGCAAVKGTKGTFAESILIDNCSFADLSGNAVSFADETDDKGRYSAENVTIRQCDFSHMLGIPVNIYRGGSDESTAGPNVSIENCRFTDCCNRERGSVLRLIGPQILTIKDCLFDNSGRGGASIRLDETSWEKVDIIGCTFLNAGRVISNYNDIK